MTAQTKCVRYCTLSVAYRRQDDGPTTPGVVRSVVCKVEVDVPCKDAIVDGLTDAAPYDCDAVALRLTAIEDCANEAEARAWTGQLTIKDLQDQCKKPDGVFDYYCDLLMALKSLEQDNDDDVATEMKQKEFVYSATEAPDCGLNFFWKQKLKPFGFVRYGPILLKKVSFIRCCMDNLSEMLVTINQQQTAMRQRRSEYRQLCSENATLVNMLNSMAAEKRDHEKELLEKFVCILNEKKKRILSQQQNTSTQESPSAKKNVEATKSGKRELSCKLKTSCAKRKSGAMEPISFSDASNVETLKPISLSDACSAQVKTMEIGKAADVINPYELDTKIDSLESSLAIKTEQLLPTSLSYDFSACRNVETLKSISFLKSRSAQVNDETMEIGKAADVIDPYELDTQIDSPESSPAVKTDPISVFDTQVVPSPCDSDTRVASSSKSPVLSSWRPVGFGYIPRVIVYRPVSDNRENSITVSTTIVDDSGQTSAALSLTSNDDHVNRVTPTLTANDQQQSKASPVCTLGKIDMEKSAKMSIMDKLWSGLIGDDFDN